MRRVLHIAVREFVATVLTKGFLFGLVIAPAGHRHRQAGDAEVEIGHGRCVDHAQPHAFTRLEQALGTLQTTSQFLSRQLAQINANAAYIGAPSSK